MMGAKDTSNIKYVAAFSVWGGAVITLVFSAITFLLREPLLNFLGASRDTFGYAQSYLTWVVIFGGILNVAMDPILIFAFHMNVTGAAIATVLSNGASVIFFLTRYRSLKEKSSISLKPRYFTFRFAGGCFL